MPPRHSHSNSGSSTGQSGQREPPRKKSAAEIPVIGQSTSQPAPTVQPPLQQQQRPPNATKIENIKNYYYQLSNSLRNVSAQLAQPDVTPGRRQALVIQQDRLQSSLNEFTEKVLRPLMAAARAGTPPAHIDGSGTSTAAVAAAAGLSHGGMLPLGTPVIQQTAQPQQPRPPASRQLQLANQHFFEAQQQQMAFQQRLQARMQFSGSAAAIAAGRTFVPSVPSLSRPASPVPHLSRVTSMQRLMSSGSGMLPSPSDEVDLLDSDLLREVGGVIEEDSFDIIPDRPVIDILPDASAEQQRIFLGLLDEAIERIAVIAALNAQHYGSSVVNERDMLDAFEEVLGPKWGRLPRWAVPGQPLPPPVKRPTLANTTHSARLAQIRKDASNLAALKEKRL